MNKEFVKKIVKAKKLEYEAFKEIMPESMKKKVDSLEVKTMDLLKNIALEIITEDVNDKEENVVKKISIN